MKWSVSRSWLQLCIFYLWSVHRILVVFVGDGELPLDLDDGWVLYNKGWTICVTVNKNAIWNNGNVSVMLNNAVNALNYRRVLLVQICSKEPEVLKSQHYVPVCLKKVSNCFNSPHCFLDRHVTPASFVRYERKLLCTADTVCNMLHNASIHRKI